MRYWTVVTPSYVSRFGWDEPPGFGADVIEVEAVSRREAVRVGVKAMLAGGQQYGWCRDQRSDGCNPFAGVTAYRSYPDDVEDDFRRKLAADPTVGPVFADWLDEQGRDDEAGEYRALANGGAK